jgi:zinc transport system substrate-binding protein
MDIKKVGIIVGILAVLAGGLYLVSESGTQEVVQDDDGVIDVMVSVLPQVDFVERIGGDKVAVTEMIPPGFSPGDIQPISGAVAEAAKCRDIFSHRAYRL